MNDIEGTCAVVFGIGLSAAGTSAGVGLLIATVSAVRRELSECGLSENNVISYNPFFPRIRCRRGK